MDASDLRGWHEVEQTLMALDLPPVPPTSDPHRLLGYVLQILPRYMEIEMLVTHLRLYASSLEQDMEQVKSYSRLLTREAISEREKKQFLERYAAQVVQERNDLLHSQGFQKKKATGHYVWHSCCRKSKTQPSDPAPSIIALRGEKLHEVRKQLETLHEELHNQEQLRNELGFLLKKMQREHDSKVTADRKHIEQLEKQILKRSVLQSSLERKLYELETALAKFDKRKKEELRVVSDHLKEAEACNVSKQKEIEALNEQVNNLKFDRDHLTEELKETTKIKDVYASQIDIVRTKCESQKCLVETLQSEIDLLQTKNVSDNCSRYASRIDRLQKANAVNEQRLRQEVDSCKQEIIKRDKFLAQMLSAKQSSASLSSQHPVSGSNGDSNIISFSGDNALYIDGALYDDHQLECIKARSSLSESQILIAHESVDWSASARNSCFDHSKNDAITSIRSLAKNSNGNVTSQNIVDSSKQGYSNEHNSACRNQHAQSNDFGESNKNGTNNFAANEPFDWEVFFDTASVISNLQSEQSDCSFSAPMNIDFGTNTIAYEISSTQMSDPKRFDDCSDSKQHDKAISVDAACKTRRLAENSLSEDEEEIENGISASQTDNEFNQSESRIIDATVMDYYKHNDDHEENIFQKVHEQNDLARDLYQMLSGLELKRKREEEKASLVEQALSEFQQLQLNVKASEQTLNIL
ncbi:hypothetical protein CCR75_008455 [Bremia lactucae]|uniref:Uncharacterized protein n=1 Tax=Bremia lactucae TaxID=4779 RepID=A0A976NZE5_BRELC|nr:hypothetical protein CCR75_008455 [Bremia lactucae]